MALLTKEERKQYFKDLGLGEYNKANILKFQKQYFVRKKDQDGVYGPDTDNLLRHVWNVLVWLPKQNGGKANFVPEEFRCGCGAAYCTGYPTYMKPHQLELVQNIRTLFGRPMTVTCGMRCRTFNRKLNGSVANSKHLSGEATDYYMTGITDTLANRKKAVPKIKKLKHHSYTYGNGINSIGGRPYAPYMGNALHTDSK